MNLNVEVIPGSTNERVYKFMADGAWHTHKEIRETCNLTKNQVSAILHRLKYYYGYLLETEPHEGYDLIRLTGRSQAVTTLPVPTIDLSLTVVGCYKAANGDLELTLRAQDGTEWRTSHLRKVVPV